MPMKGFKLGVIGTNDPISSDSQGVGWRSGGLEA
jgi:hypothetical protein